MALVILGLLFERWVVTSRSTGANSSAGRVTVLCSLVRQFTVTYPIQDERWRPANSCQNMTKMWGMGWGWMGRDGGLGL